MTLRAFGNRANIGGEGQLKAAVYAGEKQGDWVENGKHWIKYIMCPSSKQLKVC